MQSIDRFLHLCQYHFSTDSYCDARPSNLIPPFHQVRHSMSLKDAMRFIQSLEQDKALKNEILSVAITATLGDIVRIARNGGYHFTAQELRDAFTRDWSVRCSFYRSTGL
jgi:predicted ribosomally synthesized peptide with nif11-like leader